MPLTRNGEPYYGGMPLVTFCKRLKEARERELERLREQNAILRAQLAGSRKVSLGDTVLDEIFSEPF